MEGHCQGSVFFQLVMMASRCCHFAFLVVLAGCGRQGPDTSTLIVIPGQGIPKIAELGMSLNEIQDTVSDLKVRTYPGTGFPWQKNRNGDRLRLPWEKADNYTAVSHSLGLVVSVDSADRAIQALTFFSDPDPIMVDTDTWFTGRLSCGVSFADRRRVTRAEVTAVFGEPSLHRVNLSKEEWQLLQDGISLSARSSTGNGVENLFYPTNGISFCLQHDRVISFQVQQKTKRSEAGR